MRADAVGTAVAAILAVIGCSRTRDELCVPDCSELFPLGSLAVEFATPESISWSWDAAALGPDVHGYVLWYGTEEAEVRLQRGGASAWDVSDDPNLGWGESPFGPGIVRGTTVTGLAPNTLYHAELWAHFESGTSARVAAGSGRTGVAPANRLAIFDDTFPVSSWQQCVVVGPSVQDASNAVMIKDAITDPGCTDDWVNLKIGTMRFDVSGLSDRQWREAYLEARIDVRTDSGEPVPIYYLEAQVQDEAVGRIFGFSLPRYVALPARSGWHTVQIPLGLMRDDQGQPPSAATFGSSFDWLQIGADWGVALAVEVDTVALVY